MWLDICNFALHGYNCPITSGFLVLLVVKQQQWSGFIWANICAAAPWCLHLHYNNIRPLTSGTVCARHVGFMKAEMILFPPPPPQLFTLSLSHSSSTSLSLWSPLYCPMEAEAQLYSRGAEWTDVAGRRGRGRDEQPKPGCFLQIWLSNIKKKKKGERREHINKSSLYSLSHRGCNASLLLFLFFMLHETFCMF